MTEPPKDKNASVLLFNTDSQTDERNVARNRIEGYVVPNIQAFWELGGSVKRKKETHFFQLRDLWVSYSFLQLSPML